MMWLTFFCRDDRLYFQTPPPDAAFTKRTGLKYIEGTFGPKKKKTVVFFLIKKKDYCLFLVMGKIVTREQ